MSRKIPLNKTVLMQRKILYNNTSNKVTELIIKNLQGQMASQDSFAKLIKGK